MTSHNPLVIDDEAIERPPYTGIQQWATMRRAGRKAPATTSFSKHTPSMSQTLSASESPSSHNPRHSAASAYLHLPVSRPQPSNPPQAAAIHASQDLTLWQVQVCKDGATPTAVCGRYSPALNDPPVSKGGAGPYKCPRCRGGYSRIDTVRRHFPHCVTLNGNPDCLSWTDDGSYAAGAADRSTSRVDGKVKRKPRKSANADHLVTLGISELVIRFAGHYGLPSGELPRGKETKEEEERAWKKIAKNLREETRDALEIPPETEALIGLFKESGLWDSESSDEA